jgi:hypothetical protein
MRSSEDAPCIPCPSLRRCTHMDVLDINRTLYKLGHLVLSCTLYYPSLYVQTQQQKPLERKCRPWSQHSTGSHGLTGAAS